MAYMISSIQKKRTAALAGTLFAITACAAPEIETTTVEQHEPPLPATESGSAVIAEYAINNPPGQVGSVQLADSRVATVKVGHDYISAVNERCRRIFVQIQGKQSNINAVCLINQNWQTVFPPY